MDLPRGRVGAVRVFLSRSLLLWTLAVLLGAQPWEEPRVPPLTSISGISGLSAASCGGCHQQIYTEWKSSSHAWAWADAQFQGEIYKDPEVAWLCLNCHTPAANQQQERIIESGINRSPLAEPNPSFDASLQADGIGCLTCHWRPEGLAGPHRDVNAPHPVVYDPSLREVQTCTTCHQAKAQLEDALVCHFNTGEEWEQAAPGQTCQDCHMDAVHRSSAPGAPARDGRRHTWFGSGVPKGPLDPALQEIWESWKPGFDLSVQAPASAPTGQSTTISATIAHARAGHRVPTGDPERHLLVELELWSQGTLLEQATHRIGQRWEWSPVAKQISDNRLNPGEQRRYELSFTMPAAPVELRARVRHVRLTQDNLDYHLKLFARDGQTQLQQALQALPLSAVRASTAQTIQPE